MTTPTIQTIHHEEIIFGGLPGERKVIIDAALIDGKFEIMVMYDDGEELDAARSAMMRVHMKFPFRVKEFGILRREKPVQNS